VKGSAHSRKCLPNEVIKSRRQLDVRMMFVCAIKRTLSQSQCA